MMVNRIKGLNVASSAVSSTNTAAYNMMCASDSLRELCSGSTCPFTGGMDLHSLNRAELRLTRDLFQNSLVYRTSLLQEQTFNKLSHENIKRSFSTFA